ncbi:MAG: amidohydrolase family protein [Ilumatobacter sp.]|uniref:amidohydrolase family protein n=1 Tax=Ilumatobacter sp. TaxID=1967498 RepID=UPI00391A9078
MPDAAQLLTSATLSTGEIADVLIAADGTIAGVGSDLDARSGPAVTRVDLSGRVLLAAAVEPHAHLDKAFLAEVVTNPTGDLIGAIDAMRSSRHLLAVDETIERAERAARLMASNGYRAVRTHADVTAEHGLRSIEALTEVRRRVSDLIDVEIVALCGWPVSGMAGADHRALLRAAIDGGADLVGGCPHLEVIDDSGTIEAATDELLQIAVDLGRGVDLHTDETLDPSSNGLDVLAARVMSGFDLPATASHCVSLGQRTVDAQQETAERVAAAGIHVIALPHTNLFLQGRGTAPMPRALTAVDALRRAGVNVAAGADNLQDPFNPVGRACAFETAGLMIMTSHLLPENAWASVSTNSAMALGLDVGDITNAASTGGLGIGAPADLLAVPAGSVREAIAMGPTDRWVWRAGRRRLVET